ncbi:hypothetical protein SAY86_000838 [Trapa natans]|uniref:Uncharacterized protein n=1 Tax=Trapa natans TaxID=22666 RepID=A0AAN7MB12_TRANT|nr:hypothetical protein SAY86_000838 [Trapa natans]
MDQKLELQLRELGSKLDSPPPTKDALVKLLKQALTCLNELDQSPSSSLLELMLPLMKAIVLPDLLKHQDRDVKLLVATCLCEVTRITAPEAPYDDDVLKDIFQLIVGTFSGLADTAGPSFGRRVVILETLAKYRSCVVMLDLECDDLVNEMFSTFFAVASDNHPENVLSSMQTIMVVLLEESEDVREDLLSIILSKLGRDRKGVSMASRRLAMNVIESCSAKLEPVIKEFLISSISGDIEPSNEQIDYHEVIYDLYKSAPQLLFGVISYLTGELLTDHLDARLKAVRLVGDLFSLPGRTISETYQPIFSEFLKRLTDRAVEIRLSVLEYVKNCLLSDPSRAEASQIISALCDRLLDYDENVRKQVVGVICEVACQSPSSIPSETIKLIADRLRDKSALVKKYTMEKLADIFCAHLAHTDDSVDTKFDWIPGKILRCFYDKDFRSETIESVLCDSLFPGDISAKEKVKYWVRFSSGFDKVEMKALERILEQKQRLQQEMQRYISLRQTYQNGDAPETQKKVQFCFRVMSRFFSDPTKAEEDFQVLDQLKDSNIWKILTSLLDPNCSCHQSSVYQDELLKILGKKHRLHDFLSFLSVKCSYLLFNKEHVKEIFLEISAQKSAGNTEYTPSCLNILVILARHIPSLLIGFEEDLLSLLKDDSDIVKEGALHILAKAGGIVREQLATLSSSMDLILERLCLEGSRRQAKYAVHALAAITKDDGLKSLSVLYKRLVDMLEEKTHLPAVLQSLGCIAQTAMPVFETRENEIEEFIKNKILKSSSKADDSKAGWNDRSDQCLLKIYGMKTLVKSYLPVKDAHLRLGIDSLIEILRNILSFGEIASDVESSIVDKAHMKLASAKAILRLSKCWDHKIPLDVFHLTLRTPEIGFPQARKVFLSKIHQYIKDRLLDVKYVCAFLFGIDGFKASDCEEEKQHLSEILQIQYKEKARNQVSQCDANPQITHPEYILAYIVHVLAHLSCPDIDEVKEAKAYESLYRKLYLIISMIPNGDDDGKTDNNSREHESSPATSVFLTIKRSEDVTDAAKSKNSYAICDLGLSIVKRLTKTEVNLDVLPVPAALPSSLYKLHESKEVEPSEGPTGNTWLAVEGILSHFNSLKVESVSSVPAQNPGDTDLNEKEKDGSELPLKKMIKRLKPRGIKSKEGKIGHPEKEKVENDVDVLKMVREINLDNIGLSGKFDSSNGNEHSPSKQIRGEQIHQNGNRHEATVANLGSIPKRRRSSSAQRTVPTYKDKPFSKKRLVSSPNADLLASCISKKINLSSKQRSKGSDEGPTEKSSKGGEVSDVLKTGKSDTSNAKSLSDSMKKQKRKFIGGLAKCSMRETDSLEDLIGRKIKVWWPMDKQFYEGTIKSYDPSRNRHVVLYDDGDVEILNLEKERWELIEKGHNKSAKKSKLKTTPTKRVSSAKKAKSSDNSPGTGNSSKMFKAKGTPKKQMEVNKHLVETGTDDADHTYHVSDILEEEPDTSNWDGKMKLDGSEDEKKSNKRVNLKTEGKSMKERKTSDDEIDKLIQDKRKSDDEENALMNLSDKKESHKRAHSDPGSKLLKSRKNSVGHEETSNDDKDNLLMVDDQNSDEEVLVSPAKKRGSNKRVHVSAKRKPVRAKKRKLELVEASADGPRDTDISMQETENSMEEENASENLIDKNESYRRISSTFKPVNEKSESEEESGDHVESPGEDDNRSDEEENPALEEASEEKSKIEEIEGSKGELQGKTKEKSPDPSADENNEIPDDEPLKLWKKRVVKSLKKAG